MRTIFTGFRAAAVAVSLGAAALTAAPAVADVAAPSGAYELDLTHASIVWRVKHLGLAYYTGRFSSFDADLTLDVENPANSAITATIDASSVATEYPFPEREDFDGKVAGAQILKSGEFPEITFASTSIEMTGETTAVITGDLTMAGVTQEITLNATLNGALAEHPFAKVPAIGFSAEGVLDRTAFGVSFLAPKIVAPEVSFMIEAEFFMAK